MSNSNGKSQEAWGWKLADILVKFLIPVAVAYFAWAQNNVSIRSERAHRDTATELKLVEITWTYLMEQGSTKKKAALALVSTLRPQLAVKLTSALSQDEKQPPEIRIQASRFTADVSASALEGYKIDIYYRKDVPEMQRVAKSIQSILKDCNLKNDIALAPREEEFFRNTGLPYGNEVRYDFETESEAAHALAAIINSANLSLNIRLRPVRVHKTPDILSVYVWAVSYENLKSLMIKKELGGESTQQ